MKQKFFAMFAAAALLLGMSACTNDDNPSQPIPEEEEVNIPVKEIDPNEFQPIDISVALLGSLGSSAEDEVVRYWFPKVTGQVTDETMVVITDEITAANEAAIAEVLPSVTYEGVTGAIAFDDVGDAKKDMAYIKFANPETGAFDFVKTQSVGQ